MAKTIPRLYKPAELQAAISALQKNSYHDFHENEAAAVVKSLLALGFRIVKVSEPET